MEIVFGNNILSEKVQRVELSLSLSLFFSWNN